MYSTTDSLFCFLLIVCRMRLTTVSVIRLVVEWLRRTFSRNNSFGRLLNAENFSNFSECVRQPIIFECQEFDSFFRLRILFTLGHLWLSFAQNLNNLTPTPFLKIKLVLSKLQIDWFCFNNKHFCPFPGCRVGWALRNVFRIMNTATAPCGLANDYVAYKRRPRRASVLRM